MKIIKNMIIIGKSSKMMKKQDFGPFFHKLLEVLEPTGPIYSRYPGVPPGKWSKMMKKQVFGPFLAKNPKEDLWSMRISFQTLHKTPNWHLFQTYTPKMTSFYREMPLRITFWVSKNVPIRRRLLYLLPCPAGLYKARSALVKKNKKRWFFVIKSNIWTPKTVVGGWFTWEDY